MNGRWVRGWRGCEQDPCLRRIGIRPCRCWWSSTPHRRWSFPYWVLLDTEWPGTQWKERKWKTNSTSTVLLERRKRRVKDLQAWTSLATFPVSFGFLSYFDEVFQMTDVDGNQFRVPEGSKETEEILYEIPYGIGGWDGTWNWMMRSWERQRYMRSVSFM